MPPAILPTPGTPAFATSPDRRCIGIPFVAFFPDRGDDVRTLKRVCQDCPLRNTCREYAIEHHEYGFWGGTTERDRTIIRNRRARDAGRTNTAAPRSRLRRRAEAKALVAQGLSREVAAARMGITKRQVERLLTSNSGAAIDADELHRRRMAVVPLHRKGLNATQIGHELGISRKSAANAISAIRNGLVAA